MINEKRLISPLDDFENAFPGLVFRNNFTLESIGLGIFICDPIYISDVYNSMDEI